jgi:hypothetical protein
MTRSRLTVGRPNGRRLAETLPELAEYIRAGLRQQGRTDLAELLDAAQVYRVAYSSHGFGLHLIPDLDIDELLHDAQREVVAIDRPHGVKPRRWVVDLDVVQGKLWSVGVSHPGVLREAVRQLAQDLKGSYEIR